MEKLLEMAGKVTDQAEVFSIEQKSDAVRFENGALKDIESKSQSGLSLRILKDGKLGFSYTKNLLNREEILQNALDSLKGGVEAPFDLPVTKDVSCPDSYDPAIETLTNSRIVDECERVCATLIPRTSGQVNVGGSRHAGTVRVINTRGTDLSGRASLYSFGAEILFPGSYNSIGRSWISKRFEAAPDEMIDFISTFYGRAQKEVQPKGGIMKTLFLPEALYALMWRIQSATSGRNVYLKVSPVLEKKGEKILSEKLTLYDDALNDRWPDARGFDDEGMPCRSLSILREGTLENFYYDLFYAGKLKAAPTGHGYKSSMWGGEAVSFRPGPTLDHLYLKPGKQSLENLIKSIDRGMIVAGAMGAHSGNIVNGEFSIGLSPGLYVENGEILGQVKDAMAAGNVFDTMKDVIELEDTARPCYSGVFPAVLFERVSIATKG
jgi:PmbA protein